jgi:hypothetical protein
MRYAAALPWVSRGSAVRVLLAISWDFGTGMTLPISFLVAAAYGQGTDFLSPYLTAFSDFS